MVLWIYFALILVFLVHGGDMNKKIYSLLVFVLGLFLHLYFQDENKFIGITTMIVGLCFFIYFFRSKDN